MTSTLPTIPSDRTDDLHGLEYADSADLVLFMAGNQFINLAACAQVLIFEAHCLSTFTRAKGIADNLLVDLRENIPGTIEKTGNHGETMLDGFCRGRFQVNGAVFIV